MDKKNTQLKYRVFTQRLNHPTISTAAPDVDETSHKSAVLPVFPSQMELSLKAMNGMKYKAVAWSIAQIAFMRKFHELKIVFKRPA